MKTSTPKTGTPLSNQLRKGVWLIKFLMTGIVLAGLGSAGFAVDANPPSILPVPQKMVVSAGAFKLAPTTHICTDAVSRATGEYLAAQLRQSTGYKFTVSVGAKFGAVRGAILITSAGAKADLGAEGYELTVTQDSVVIRAPQQAGSFYGVQTFLQLLPPEVFAAQTVNGVSWTMPCVQIEDQPRFKWRGMMLDVSRQFFSKAEVKKVLDELALHKLNTFHWHLVDDEGWRIEIKKYPKLTEVGAWRDGIGFDMNPKASMAYGPDGRYCGFYTQDDLRELVAYATARHITIVPEIEMPGHCGAATDAYPELRCVPSTNKLPGTAAWVAPGAVARGVYCAGQDRTFEFLQDVLVEVMALFPGKYIHIGGDEVNRGDWQQCVQCQARIQAEGLKDVNELQNYFMRRVEKFLSGKNRVQISWGETLASGLAQTATFMDWIGGAAEAASAGHDVVMSPTSACYLDYYQADASLEPKAQGGYLTLRHAYDFEPISTKLDPKFHTHILGAQGNLWTPYMASLKHLEYMTFPRLTALAEVTWSPKAARNWEDFNRRLPVQFQRFAQLGINYRRLGNDQRLDRSNQPKTAVDIGEWTAAQLTNQSHSILEWDVTLQLTQPGKYRVDLNYTHGEHALIVYAASLLEDGLEIARDTREKFTGSGDSFAVYTFALPVRKAGANYRVRAEAAGSGGTNSFGKVFLSQQPIMGGEAKAGLNLIPLPVATETKPGPFALTAKTKISTDGPLAETAGIVAQSLRERTGLPLPLTRQGTIRLVVSPRLPAEGYELEVMPKAVILRASTATGAFYGGQTLLQLLASNTLPGVMITDAPRFPWRGLMLDCSRTFQSLEYLHQTIDRMAFYKMNVLHLHLTDDQGWRLEIKRYPELTGKGARFADKWKAPAAHQGYYTQAQMKELIRYAGARGVTIVPEIEMPGHSLAALACFPELSCTGGPFEIFPFAQWPADATLGEFCAGNAATFTFLTNVLAEVIALFPSRYIHLGGDEVPKDRWKTCTKCQARLKAEGLKDELELQSYLIRRIEKFVNVQGRTLIGWDEILEGGLAPNAAVMSWRGVSGGIAAARAGHPVVMSPTSHCYFDYPYSAIDTLRAYSYEPVPPELDAAQAKSVLGLQANFWSHLDREPDLVDAQLFPRLLGIAERGWSPKDTRDPKDFARRVAAQLTNLDRFAVQYRKEGAPFWTPAQMTEEFRPLEWDITPLICGAGNYEVTFTYKSGAHRLAMRSVAVLAEGKVVASDPHLGVTGGVHSQNTYRLNLPPSAPGTAYTLRAEVRSEGGTDSSGEIQIRPKR